VFGLAGIEAMRVRRRQAAVMADPVVRLASASMPRSRPPRPASWRVA